MRIPIERGGDPGAKSGCGRLLVLLDVSPLLRDGSLEVTAAGLDGAILAVLRVMQHLKRQQQSFSPSSAGPEELGSFSGGHLRWGYRLFDSRGMGVGKTPGELQRLLKREGGCKGSYSQLDLESMRSFSSSLLSVTTALSGKRLERHRDGCLKRWFQSQPQTQSQSNTIPSVCDMYEGHDVSSKACLLRSIVECIHEIEFDLSGEDRLGTTESAPRRNYLLLWSPCPRSKDDLKAYENDGDFSRGKDNLRQGLAKLSAKFATHKTSLLWLDSSFPKGPGNAVEGERMLDGMRQIAVCLSEMDGDLVPREMLTCGPWLLPGICLPFGATARSDGESSLELHIKAPWGQGQISASYFLTQQGGAGGGETKNRPRLLQLTIRGCTRAAEVCVSWFNSALDCATLVLNECLNDSACVSHPFKGWGRWVSAMALRGLVGIVDISACSRVSSVHFKCLGMVIPITATSAILKFRMAPQEVTGAEGSFKSLFEETGEFLGGENDDLPISDSELESSFPICLVSNSNIARAALKASTCTFDAVSQRFQEPVLSDTGTQSYLIGRDFESRPALLQRSSTMSSTSSADVAALKVSTDEHSHKYPPRSDASLPQDGVEMFATSGAESFTRSLSPEISMRCRYCPLPALLYPTLRCLPQGESELKAISDSLSAALQEGEEFNSVRSDLDARALDVLSEIRATKYVSPERPSVCSAAISQSDEIVLPIDGVAEPRSSAAREEALSILSRGYRDCIACGEPSVSEWSVEAIEKAVRDEGMAAIISFIESSLLLKPKQLMARHQKRLSDKTLSSKDIFHMRIRELEVQAMLRLQLNLFKNAKDPLPPKQNKLLLKILEPLSFLLDSDNLTQGCQSSVGEGNFTTFLAQYVVKHFGELLPQTIAQLYVAFERPLPEALKQQGPEEAALNASSDAMFGDGLSQEHEPSPVRPVRKRDLAQEKSLTLPLARGSLPISRFPGQRTKPPKLFSGPTMPRKVAPQHASRRTVVSETPIKQTHFSNKRIDSRDGISSAVTSAAIRPRALKMPTSNAGDKKNKDDTTPRLKRKRLIVDESPPDHDSRRRSGGF